MVLTVPVENGILIESSFFSFPVRPPIITEGMLQRWGKGSQLECILRSDPAGVLAKVCLTDADNAGDIRGHMFEAADETYVPG